MNIGIIGTGYVGLVTGACFAEFGVYVTCVDKDPLKIEQLKKGIIPFFEPGLETLVNKNIKNGRLKFSTNIADAVKESLVIFIAVGTPPRGDGSADLSYVEEVAREIARNMNGYKVIVTKSTVPVGTGEKLKKIISENFKEPHKFDIVSNPEFLREGSAIEDFMRPNRVVIGAQSPEAIAIMKDLYRPLYLIETPFVITNVETAELIKYASNSFLAVKISFINEIANLCEKVGADVHVVAKAMGLDQRIGPKFLHAGPGYGGSCFPKDTLAIVRLAEEHGEELNIIKAAIKVNSLQRERMVRKIKSSMGELKGKVMAILGLSFKPNTNDIRDAPSIYIINELKKEGAIIRTFDPAAMDDMKTIFPDIIYCNDAYEACTEVDAVVIVTEWNEFRNLELERILSLVRDKYFFDLRNVYEPLKMKQLGFKYYSVGRSLNNAGTMPT